MKLLLDTHILLWAAGDPNRLREVTKNNPPILLAFWPVFFVAAKGEYFNMHLLPLLEYEPKFGAIMGRLFFVTSLTGEACDRLIYVTHHINIHPSLSYGKRI